ncbi:MAG: sulfatase [Verrucomicrobiota bacterium]
MLARITLAAAAFLGALVVSPAAPATKPNILFIAVDDLRPDLGAYGVGHAKTPALDRFASTARVFTHHYIHVPTCGASRAALLRGRYPTERAHISNNAIAATHAQWGDANLPAWLQRQGYRTFALGKITHYPGGRTGRHWAEGPVELPDAWERCWIPDAPWKNAEAMMHGYANGGARIPGKTPALETFAGGDDAYPDFWVADEAVSTLRSLATSERPWFFGVGFFKPHLPFVAPRKYFDLHDPAKIPAPPRYPDAEKALGWHKSGEFRGNYAHGGRDPEKDEAYARELRQAYAASVSYVDAQVGRVLAALEALDLAKNTVVVVWGDHGFLLGEHGIWGKHCLYEGSVRSPLMIRAPGLARAGARSAAIVETVDIFPTLVDLCNLPQPQGLDGRSLRPQLADPATPSSKPAVAFYSDGQRTIRDERWRLLAREGVGASARQGVELFDLKADPQELREVSAAHPEVVARLLSTLPKYPEPRPGAKK